MSFKRVFPGYLEDPYGCPRQRHQQEGERMDGRATAAELGQHHLAVAGVAEQQQHLASPQARGFAATTGWREAGGSACRGWRRGGAKVVRDRRGLPHLPRRHAASLAAPPPILTAPLVSMRHRQGRRGEGTDAGDDVRRAEILECHWLLRVRQRSVVPAM
jgi:hypothetical protein